jgi:inorganic triphosphatase YgiF
MPNEVELKFDLDPGDLALVRESPPLSLAACDTQDHETLYFDTEDGALRAAGYSLRVRRTGDRFVQTLKGRNGHAGNGGSVGLFIRSEWEESVPAFVPSLDALKGQVAKRVRARIQGDKLKSVMCTRFQRTRWTVDYRESRIEVVLDEGSVSDHHAEAPICELELELIRGKPRSLFRLAEEIGDTVPLRLGVLSKGERGYALAERRLGAAAGAEPVGLNAQLDQRTAFRAVAQACLRHFRLNEIALLSGSRDAEALHQARVALRRLRSAFALFHPIIAGKDFRRLRGELKWLARQLGEARDLDVLIAAAEKPSAALRRRRENAYAAVEAVLHTPRVRGVILHLAAWIEAGGWRFREGAGDPLGPFAQHQLDRLWRKVERRGSKLAELDWESRHRLRIDAKKLRYSAEFLSGLYAGRQVRGRREKFVAGLKSLQDRLGEMNDARLGGIEAPAELMAGARAAFARTVDAAVYWRD